MTEDINILHVSEKEKLEMERILQEQQEAVHWRQVHGQKSVDVQSSRKLDRQISTEKSMQWNKQQFVTAEDTQISQLQSYEHEQISHKIQNQQAKHWRSKRQNQLMKEDEKELTRRLQEQQETLQKPDLKLMLRTQDEIVTSVEKQMGHKSYEEMIDLLPEQVEAKQAPEQPVMWQRGKKSKTRTEQFSNSTNIEHDVPLKSYEEMLDVLPEEDRRVQVVEEQPVMWERGKKKPPAAQKSKKSYEETVDLLPEETKTKVIEEHPVLWQRGKKQKTVKKSLDTIPPMTYEETVDVMPEETKKEEDKEGQPFMWQRGKKNIIVDKPLEVKEVVDILPEEIKKEDGVTEQAVSWQLGKKQKPKTHQEVLSLESTIIENPATVVEHVKSKHRPKQMIIEPEQPREAVQLKQVPSMKSVEQPNKSEREENTEELKPVEYVIQGVEEQQQPLDDMTKLVKKHTQNKCLKDRIRIPKDDTEDAALLASEEDEIKPYNITTEETYPVTKKEKLLPKIKPFDIVEEVKPKTPAVRKQLPESEEQNKEEIILNSLRKSPQVTEEVPEAKTKNFVETRVYDEVVETKTKKKKPKALKKTESEEVPDVEDETLEKFEQPQEVKTGQPLPVVEQIGEIPEVDLSEDDMLEKPVSHLPVKEKLKPVRKTSKPLPQEIQIEEVKLKPAKRPSPLQKETPEYVELKHVEALDVEIKQEEKKKTKKLRKLKQENLHEIPDTERVKLEQPEHIEIEKEIIPIMPENANSYQREKKEPSVKDVIKEKKWPTGKTRPLPDELPEEVKLKPIPAKPKEISEKPIRAAEITKPKYDDKVQREEKELEISAPEVIEEKERVKKEMKKKQKLLKATPSIEVQDAEEIAESFVEPITEEEQVEEVPIENVLEATVAVSQQVLLDEEVVPTEEKLASKQKAQKKRTKRLKDVSFKDQPELLEGTVAENEAVLEVQEEETEEVSKKFIQLKKTEDLRPQFITTEQLIELDVEDLRRDLGMKLSSNIVKKEKRTVNIDDSQPLPELELITQKRVPDDEEVEEENPEEIIEETKEEEKREVTKKKKKNVKPPRITEKLSPRFCVEQQPTVLECKVEGQPFPEINWYFNDTLLFASEKYELNVIDDVAQLKITKVTPNDIGLYTCEVKNEAGLAKTTTNITLGK